MTRLCFTGHQAFSGCLSRRMMIFYGRGPFSIHQGFPSGIVYAHQLRITIGQLVDDLELLAKATEPEEWNGRIEYLPLG